MVPCVQCGQSNRLGARFCQHCGKLAAAVALPDVQRYETGKLPTDLTLYGQEGDEYLVRPMIARGGMGAIYRLIRTRDKTEWALKEMSESVIDPNDRQQTIRAFHQEAQLLIKLDHENLPKVVDVFESNGRQYMVMELIKGKTLFRMLDDATGLLPHDEVLTWGAQLCHVLDYLHHQKPPIIYRDLKPENVMVEQASGTVKLIDFGIARRYKGGKSKDTMLLGTKGYAAPEQYGKGETDARADIYSLGATLHHLLTGRDPSDTPFQFDPIEKHNFRVPRRAREAIMMAVKPSQDDRPQTAAEFYHLLTGQPLTRQVEAKPKLAPPDIAKKRTPSRPIVKPKSAPLLPKKSLSLGALPKGKPASATLPISVTGSALRITSDQPWLHVSPARASSRTKEVKVEVDTSQLAFGRQEWAVAHKPGSPPGWLWVGLLKWGALHARYLVPVGRDYTGAVQVGVDKADVTVRVEPGRVQKWIGWALTGLAVAGEGAGLGYLIALLLA